MLESKYQAYLIKLLHKMFPDCEVWKNDARQRYPDLIILFGNRWAMLEVKKTEDEPYQPNQLYYLERFNGMSFAAMICPENEEEVLDELQQALRSRR